MAFSQFRFYFLNACLRVYKSNSTALRSTNSKVFFKYIKRSLFVEKLLKLRLKSFIGQKVQLN